MKKADVIDLVKYHYADNELEFKNQAVRIANDFDNSGDSLCAKEIMQIISSRKSIFQKSEDSIVEDNLAVAKLDTKDMLLPKAITNDINGIVNAIKRKAPGINKFLFVGSPGTGKTESAKQIAKELEKYNIDKKKINIEVPLDCLGTYEVRIDLYKDAIAKVKVTLQKESR